MQNAINTLRIQNFKSIKDVTMQPRRVNLLIGMPNVGKSNVLEALSLLGGIAYEQTEKFMGSFIRYEEPRQMFYDNLVANTIKVETDKDIVLIGKSEEEIKFNAIIAPIKSYRKVVEQAELRSKGKYIFGDEDRLIIDDFGKVIDGWERIYTPSDIEYIYTSFDRQGNFNIDVNTRSIKTTRQYVLKLAIRPYIFSKYVKLGNEYSKTFLRPPFGDNLIDVIQAYPKFRKEIGLFIEKYGLRLMLRVDERRLEIIKDLDGVIYSYPYSSIADTLQRIIFYLAVIESNDDSIILPEEPEAHSFPEYVSMMGRRIVESKNNQFFIATHSPYLVTEILEQMLPFDKETDELAIFLAYYEDYQTKIHQLTDDEVRSIRQDSIDIFYNLDRFTPGRNEPEVFTPHPAPNA